MQGTQGPASGKALHVTAQFQYWMFLTPPQREMWSFARVAVKKGKAPHLPGSTQKSLDLMQVLETQKVTVDNQVVAGLPGGQMAQEVGLTLFSLWYLWASMTILWVCIQCLNIELRQTFKASGLIPQCFSDSQVRLLCQVRPSINPGLFSPMHACMHANSLQLCPALVWRQGQQPTRLLLSTGFSG